MLKSEREDIKLRRKRPERQLYVPPQRRSLLNDSSKLQNTQNHASHTSSKKEKVTSVETNDLQNKPDINGESLDKIICQKPDDYVHSKIPFFEFLLYSYFIQSRWKFIISGNQLKFQSKYEFNGYHHNFISFYPNNSCFLYQENLKNQCDYYFCIDYFPFDTRKKNFQYQLYSQTIEKVPLIVTDFYNKNSDLLKQFSIFCDCDVYSIANTFFIDNSCKYFPDLHSILEGYQTNSIFDTFDNISDMSDYTTLSKKDNESASKSPFKETQVTTPVNKSKIAKNHKQSNASEHSLRKELALEKTDHEEEVEIMRKTKEHINRKTRPIMKYVEKSNDTLNIGDDGLKNWEDLFDDEGELKEELLGVEKLNNKPEKKVISKENSVEINPEDVKHIEELEHLVELYDFPASFKSQDLIQAFGNINCDAMYLKWVDDTHAILVLGTLTQAMKAVSLNNPLIKVRPMEAASRSTLAIAYKSDLKPAMKRPQTNLQTARRFITAALGTKIGVSKEKMAKEREDLKAAREMKKLLKKNERDAWEGNLQSSLTESGM